MVNICLIFMLGCLPTEPTEALIFVPDMRVPYKTRDWSKVRTYDEWIVIGCSGYADTEEFACQEIEKARYAKLLRRRIPKKPMGLLCTDHRKYPDCEEYTWANPISVGVPEPRYMRVQLPQKIKACKS